MWDYRDSAPAGGTGPRCWTPPPWRAGGRHVLVGGGWATSAVTVPHTGDLGAPQVHISVHIYANCVGLSRCSAGRRHRALLLDRPRAWAGGPHVGGGWATSAVTLLNTGTVDAPQVHASEHIYVCSAGLSTFSAVRRPRAPLSAGPRETRRAHVGGRRALSGVNFLAVARTRVIPVILGIAAASEFRENSRFPGRATRRRVVTGSAAEHVPRGALFSSVFL